MPNKDSTLHTQRLANAPRCTAMAKTTRCRCKGPAVTGWTVCRMHGARGGAPFGCANGAWQHGERTNQAKMTRQHLTNLFKTADTARKAISD